MLWLSRDNFESSSLNLVLSVMAEHPWQPRHAVDKGTLPYKLEEGSSVSVICRR